MCRVCPRGSPEGHSPFGRRYGGCASINLLLYSRGSPEGHRSNGGSLRVSLRTSLLSLFPLPLRKGARGMVRRGRLPWATRHRCPATAPIASLRLAMTGSGWRPAPGYASSSSTYISGLPATHASMLIRLRWGSRCAISVMSARRCWGSVMWVALARRSAWTPCFR